MLMDVFLRRGSIALDQWSSNLWAIDPHLLSDQGDIGLKCTINATHLNQS